MNYTCIGHLYNARGAEAHISGYTIKLAIRSGKQEAQKKYFTNFRETQSNYFGYGYVSFA